MEEQEEAAKQMAAIGYAGGGDDGGDEVDGRGDARTPKRRRLSEDGATRDKATQDGATRDGATRDGASEDDLVDPARPDRSPDRAHHHARRQSVADR